MLLDGGINRNNESNPYIGGDTVGEQIDGFNVNIRGIKNTGDTHLHLMALEVRKSPVDGFLHAPLYPPCHFELPGACGKAHLKTVETDPTPLAYGCCINRSRGQRVGGYQVSSAFFRHSNVKFFTCVVVDVGERGLVVFEGTHLLQLFFDPSTTFHGNIE